MSHGIESMVWERLARLSSYPTIFQQQLRRTKRMFDYPVRDLATLLSKYSSVGELSLHWLQICFQRVSHYLALSPLSSRHNVLWISLQCNKNDCWIDRLSCFLRNFLCKEIMEHHVINNAFWWWKWVNGPWSMIKVLIRTKVPSFFAVLPVIIFSQICPHWIP